MTNEEDWEGNEIGSCGKSVKELEEMKLKKGAESQEECKEFDDFKMVSVAVKGVWSRRRPRCS